MSVSLLSPNPKIQTYGCFSRVYKLVRPTGDVSRVSFSLPGSQNNIAAEYPMVDSRWVCVPGLVVG